MTKIILLGPIAQVGKDTVADKLLNLVTPSMKVKFADPIREYCNNMNLPGPDGRNLNFFSEDKAIKEITRPILIAVGEGMKKLHGNEFWATKTKQIIAHSKALKNFLISDWRFTYEFYELLSPDTEVLPVCIDKEGTEPYNMTELINRAYCFDLATKYGRIYEIGRNWEGQAEMVQSLKEWIDS